MPRCCGAAPPFYPQNPFCFWRLFHKQWEVVVAPSRCPRLGSEGLEGPAGPGMPQARGSSQSLSFARLRTQSGALVPALALTCLWPALASVSSGILWKQDPVLAGSWEQRWGAV